MKFPYPLLNEQSARTKVNQLGATKRPFLLIVSYDKRQNYLIPLDEINPKAILFDFPNLTNSASLLPKNEPILWESMPISFHKYEQAFKELMPFLKRGETALANLTFPTKVKSNLSLKAMFLRSQAKYRLYLQDHFVSFSPETFITINEGEIATYPMKGTINADLPEAEFRLMNDEKEQKEHLTIVEEAKRDLAQVAQNIRVPKFRYVDRLERTERDGSSGAILQTSSKIAGDLPKNFHQKLGDLLFKLLPASSITGSPRAKTVEILQGIETYSRGFYSGIAGIFDGENFDSAVLIRFVEATPTPGEYLFKSGGGITALSQADKEYAELKEKVYLPFNS